VTPHSDRLRGTLSGPSEANTPSFNRVMKYLLLLPLAVQGLAILVDEFYFHFARGLPRWERIGHPLDTLTVLAPVLWLVFTLPSQRNLIVYIVAAAFSCFFVTKDEFVHANLCVPAEHLTHAVLFIAHPLAFAALAPLWPLYHVPAGAVAWVELFRGLESALPAQAAVLALYMIYQAVYWNLIWKAPATEIAAR
jgi:hypothetical protein